MFKQIIIILTCSIFIFGSSNTVAEQTDSSPYDFNWKGARDMSGAFMMCAFTAYTQGDCPQVLIKCFTDFDLIRVRLFSLEYKCLSLYAFLSSEEDVVNTLEHAENDVGVDTGLPEEEQIISDVHSDNEQISDPENEQSIEEENISRFAIYAVAEENTNELVESDYFDFYYFGDDQGNGGWGTSDYKKNEFIELYYTGITEEQAYNNAFDEAYTLEYNETYSSVYSAEYNNLLSEADYTIDPISGERLYSEAVLSSIHYNSDITANLEATDQANIAGVQQGIIAANEQESIVDSAYMDWRSNQEWGSLGYGKDEFLGNYNEDRYSTYYTTFVNAASSCNLGCAREQALDAVVGLPYYTI